MGRLKQLAKKALQIPDIVAKAHVGAYAAQAAYFFMLSLIPIILLLLTLVQFTPVTKADVMTAVIQVFPSSVDPLLTSIINQVYNQSVSVIPLTLLVTVWSAGRGVLSMATGLNSVLGCPETRNYFFLRIRAAAYTVLFVMVIILLLVLSVFGDSLNLFILKNLPFLSRLADRWLSLRFIVTPVVLMVFFLLIYKFLPNRKDRLLKQLPGAAFASVGWMAVSWVFSVYLDIFTGFSTMYGSLTTIVLVMLWMYLCMYCILLGSEVNVLLRDVVFVGKGKPPRGSR